jgi:hypothetical protein
VDWKTVAVSKVSNLIAQIVVVAKTESATYTVEALTALIGGILMPVVEAIFLAIIVYKFLTLGFGSSPERLLPVLEKILLQRDYLAEELNVQVDDYYPKWNVSAEEVDLDELRIEETDLTEYSF